MTYQRPLSAAQAKECENAIRPQCKCRCGGAAHGKARLREMPGYVESVAMTPKATTAEVLFFQQLPPTDPHHLPTAQEAKDMRRWRKLVKASEKQVASLKAALALGPTESYAAWYKEEIASAEKKLAELRESPPLSYRKHDPRAGGKVIDLMVALKESLAGTKGGAQ